MKTGQTFRCLFWAVLYCVLYLVTAAEEDLLDFDFDADLKEIDWNYDSEKMSTEVQKHMEPKVQPNMLTFDDYSEENQVRPFDWRENVLRIALSKALTNTQLRQKFVEVMPILRVLSTQQRLALSALISAQINAKKGQELKLEQVRMMFGDDKKLLLPIVYDIANLVRNSARRYLPYDLKPVAHPAKLQNQQPPIAINRRNDELSTAEADDDAKDIGTIVVPAATATAAADDSSLEDFFDDMPADVLDPLSINQELQADATKLTLPTLATLPTTTGTSAEDDSKPAPKRTRRAATPSEFVHKLLRAVPLNSNEDALAHSSASSAVKLNTTSFVVPKEAELFSTVSSTTAGSGVSATNTPTVTPSSAADSTQSYQQIEDLVFASLNGTELDLNANATAASNAADEPLPNPEELIAGPRYRINGNKRYAVRSKQSAAKRKRVQPAATRTRSKGPARNAFASGSDVGAVVVPKKCERFTASMCIRTDDYPLDQIMGSIRRHKNAMSALLAEFHDKTANLHFDDELEDFSYNRREDDATGGSMCHSVVRYARPQKARSASGEWKYIVNTGQHTQTLRLEKCTNPQESCSYLAQNYRSHCAQIYNYHRLLSWDKTRGLHVDIFKVPTCCSCQVDGYRQQFPPIKSKDFSPAYSPDTYSTINDELDYNDEEDDEDFNYQLNSKFTHHKYGADTLGYDDNELLLSSKQVRTKVRAPPNPTLGSYLSPPESEEYEKNFAYKQQLQEHSSAVGSAATGKNLIRDLAHRRPSYKRLNGSPIYNEPRLDMDFAPSETHADKEVNFAGNSRATANKRVPQKRQRIYSVPHTATVSTVTTAATTATTDPATRSQSAAAAAAATSATTRGAISGSRGGIATNAHQAAAPARTSYYAPQPHGHSNHNVRSSGSSAGGKSKSRLHAPAATTLATTSTTEPTQQRPAYQQPTLVQSSIPIYHVSSIYNAANYNITAVAAGGSSSSSGSAPKRINYSYHPIIDFFENNKYSTPTDVNALTASATALYPNEQQLQPSGDELLLPHKIPKASTYDVQQTRERRIGLGAGAGAGGGVGGGVRGMAATAAATAAAADGTDFRVEDNAWHPVIVETQVLPHV